VFVKTRLLDLYKLKQAGVSLFVLALLQKFITIIVITDRQGSVDYVKR